MSDINNLAKLLLKGRNISHGINHALKVKDNALLISKKLNINDSYILCKIETAALFHNLWNYKYVNPQSIEYSKIKSKFNYELKKKFYSEQEIKDIEIIINNISLSREINLRNNEELLNLKHLQLIRDIVSDANKIEMLGIHGIERIVDYQLYKYPKTTSNNLKSIVISVYNNKISKLLDENYIKTKPGKEIAKPLMQEMKNYIKMIK